MITDTWPGECGERLTVDQAIEVGDTWALRLAHLREFVERAEKTEGRSNAYYSDTLRMLESDAARNRND